MYLYLLFDENPKSTKNITRLLEKIDEKCEIMASNGILFKNIELVYPKDKQRVMGELDIKTFPALIFDSGEIVYKYSPILQKLNSMVGSISDKINYGDDELNIRGDHMRYMLGHQFNEDNKNEFDTAADIADKFEGYYSRKGTRPDNNRPKSSLFGGNNNNPAPSAPLLDDDMFDEMDESFQEFDEPIARDTNPANISKKIYPKDVTVYWENKEET